MAKYHNIVEPVETIFQTSTMTLTQIFFEWPKAKAELFLNCVFVMCKEPACRTQVHLCTKFLIIQVSL